MKKLLKTFGNLQGKLSPETLRMITNQTLTKLNSYKPGVLDEMRKLSQKTIKYIRDMKNKELSKETSERKRRMIKKFSARLVKAIRSLTPKTLDYVMKIRDTPRYVKDMIRRIPSHVKDVIKTMSVKDMMKIRKILKSGDKKLMKKHMDFLGNFPKNVLDVITKVNPVVLIKIRKPHVRLSVKQLVKKLSPEVLYKLKKLSAADINKIKNSRPGSVCLADYPENLVKLIKRLPHNIIKHVRTTPKVDSNKILRKVSVGIKNQIKTLSPSVIKRIREYKLIPNSMLSEKERNFLNRFPTNLIKVVSLLPIKVIRRLQRHCAREIMRELTFKMKEQLRDINVDTISKIKGLSAVPSSVLSDSEKEFLNGFNRKIIKTISCLPMKKLMKLRIDAMPVDVKQIIKTLPRKVKNALNKLYPEEISKIRKIANKPKEARSSGEKEFLENYSEELIQLILSLNPKVIAVIKTPIRIPTPPPMPPPKPLSHDQRIRLSPPVRMPACAPVKPTTPPSIPSSPPPSPIVKPTVPMTTPPRPVRPTSPPPLPIVRGHGKPFSTPPKVYGPTQFTHMGCFNDSSKRAIPKFVGKVNNKLDCEELALKHGADVFGLQYGGQCFVGNHKVDAHFKKYGKKDYCPALGGGWSQQVYLKTSVVKSEKVLSDRDEEMRRSSEKSKADYERSLKEAAERERRLRELNAEKERELREKAMRDKERADRLKAAADAAAAKAREMLKKAELEFDTEKLKELRRKAAELQAKAEEAARREKEARLLEEMNKKKAEAARIKAEFDAKAAKAEELKRIAEQLRIKGEEDARKARELKERLARETDATKAAELRAKMAALEAKAIADAKNAAALKAKAQEEERLANERRARAQAELAAQKAAELKRKSEENAKRAMELQVKADLEANAKKAAELRAEAEAARLKSELEAKKAAEAKREAANNVILSKFTNVGCYGDDYSKVIPKYVGKVKSAAQCARLAEENNSNLFGVQNGGECYVGNENGDMKFKRNGRRDGCSALGGSGAQQTYLRSDTLEEINRKKAAEIREREEALRRKLKEDEERRQAEERERRERERKAREEENRKRAERERREREERENRERSERSEREASIKREAAERERRDRERREKEQREREERERQEREKNAFKHMGCWGDGGDRAVRHYRGNVGNKEQCERIAVAHGDNVYATQYYGQCFTGKEGETSNFQKYGRRDGCPPMGGGWTQQVYVKGDALEKAKALEERKKAEEAALLGNYDHLGCYADGGDRAIKNFRGNVPTIKDCAKRANDAGDNVFGVQYYGECWTGKEGQNGTDLAKYGKRDGCPPMGGGWSQQVFLKKGVKVGGDKKFQRAWYGNRFEGRGADVSGKVNEYIRAGRSGIPINNGVFGDPLGGVYKYLFVKLNNGSVQNMGGEGGYMDFGRLR
ncbi:MAG: hypothetical protein EB127_12820 [Alphaproteobacteria bacterium]|nr:hypothetical protein [Alphaproteobacteria bacterium]